MPILIKEMEENILKGDNDKIVIQRKDMKEKDINANITWEYKEMR